MRPIERKFVIPPKSVQRIHLAVQPVPGGEERAIAHAMADCEVRVMDGRLGRIEWRDSLRELDRSYEDTYPVPLS